MTFVEAAVLLAVAVLGIEAAWLMLRWRRGGSMLNPAQILTMVGAGAGLLLALLAAVTQSPPLLTLAALGCGGALHAADLWQRLRG